MVRSNVIKYNDREAKMKYTAIIEMYSTSSHSYEQTVVFDAVNEMELDEMFLHYANGDSWPGISIDNSKEPAHFNEGGGFSSKLVSFVDETGKDCRYLDKHGELT